MIRELHPKKLSKEYRKGKPFPHIVIKNFLKPAIAKQLLSALKKEDFKEKDSDLFYFFHTSDLTYTQQNIIKEFHSVLKSKDFRQVLKEITGVAVSGTVDISGQLYSETGYLLPHDDKLEGRKLAYILNLTQDFTKKDGGTLDLFSTKSGKPDKVAKSYAPEFNSFTLFTVSNKSFHQVSEVINFKDRFSISGWFHG